MKRVRLASVGIGFATSLLSLSLNNAIIASGDLEGFEEDVGVEASETGETKKKSRLSRLKSKVTQSVSREVGKSSVVKSGKEFIGKTGEIAKAQSPKETAKAVGKAGYAGVELGVRAATAPLRAEIRAGKSVASRLTGKNKKQAALEEQDRIADQKEEQAEKERLENWHKNPENRQRFEQHRAQEHARMDAADRLAEEKQRDLQEEKAAHRKQEIDRLVAQKEKQEEKERKLRYKQEQQQPEPQVEQRQSSSGRPAIIPQTPNDPFNIKRRSSRANRAQSGEGAKFEEKQEVTQNAPVSEPDDFKSRTLQGLRGMKENAHLSDQQIEEIYQKYYGWTENQ